MSAARRRGGFRQVLDLRGDDDAALRLDAGKFQDVAEVATAAVSPIEVDLGRILVAVDGDRERDVASRPERVEHQFCSVEGRLMISAFSPQLKSLRPKYMVPSAFTDGP
jgi:hypothetical protein